MPILEFENGPYANQQISIEEGPITIGRNEEATLILDDESVSGAHAEIEERIDSWILKDLGSSNGTEVNGAAITIKKLEDQDVVDVGNLRFVFTESTTPQSAPPIPKTTPNPARIPQPQNTEASQEDIQLVTEMKERTERLRAEASKVIVGQTEVLDEVLMCVLANGHALLIGLPGMAKTLMVRTLATVLNLEFKRVQFTPDLMPTDIIGTDVLETNRDTGEKEFRFIKGPLFCNLLLADEINRTPPKTQAALLEAMQEKLVTAGNTTYKLDAPFFVLATQNPIEQEGTYPLPEAQLDRFMFNIWVDYPSADEEEQIIGATTAGTMQEPEPVLTQEEILQLQDVVRKIPVSQHVIKYAIRLVRATRPGNEEAPDVTKEYVSTGAGPRAGQNLVLAAKARAVLEGRLHVSCNDIRLAALPVLRHRLQTTFAADSEGLTSVDIINRILAEVSEPDATQYPQG